MLLGIILWKLISSYTLKDPSEEKQATKRVPTLLQSHHPNQSKEARKDAPSRTKATMPATTVLFQQAFNTKMEHLLNITEC